MENRYPTGKAITSLIKKLNLPKRSKYSQDWEYEIADSERVDEFITYYQNNLSDEDEKFTLMLIIIESCNDAISENNLENKTWEKVKKSLMEDYYIHKQTIDYWCSEEEKDIEDCFAITPLIREIKKICGKAVCQSRDKIE